MGFNDETCYKELIGTIARTWLLIKQHAKVMLHNMDYDLTFEQIMVIHILGKEEGQNIGIIAEKADRERTTISRMVDGLEKRNLVIRIPDKTDKRQKMLYLTPLGKERVKEMAPTGKLFHSNVYKGISEEEIQTCIKTLNKMYANLEK